MGFTSCETWKAAGIWFALRRFEMCWDWLSTEVKTNYPLLYVLVV